MSDGHRLLELIEEGIVEHGGDLGGWTRITDDALQLFDGRVTLRVDVNDGGSDQFKSVHAHVFTTLHEHEDEVLDACVFGMGDEALGQVAMLWITCVAGPIRSFIDGTPVCMTSQAGVQGGNAEEGYSPDDYGLPNLRAFVGPLFGRGIPDDPEDDGMEDGLPWFQYAAESAAPRKVHLAKATVMAHGTEGWSRELEVDGHDVSHSDPQWAHGTPAPDGGYFVRYAVFEFPRNSTAIAHRANLEQAIRLFIELYPKYEEVDDLLAKMVGDGFDPDLVHEVESISTIAFGRLLFEERGVEYPPTVIRARANGKVEMNVPLMSLPAYSRARSIFAQLREEMSSDDLFNICLYSAESQGILQAIEAEAEVEGLTLYPCVVPDRNVSQATMDRALAKLHELIDDAKPPEDDPSNKKPWWKFW